MFLIQIYEGESACVTNRGMANAEEMLFARNSCENAKKSGKIPLCDCLVT